MADNTWVNFTPYDEQMAEIQRRQRMADLMQQQAQAPLETPQSGGRMIAKVSPVAGLAKMLQAYMAGKQQRDIGQQQKELGRQDVQNAMSLMDRLQAGKVSEMSPDQALAASMSTQPTAQAPNQPFSNVEQRQFLATQGMLGGPKTQALAAALMPKPETPEYYDAVPVTINGVTKMVQYSKGAGAPRILEGQKFEKPEKPSLTQLEQLHQYRDRLSSANPNDPRIQDVNDEIRKIKTSGPATVVNVDTKAGNEIIKPFIDKIAEGYQSATASKDVLAQIDSLEGLTKSGTFTGAMAPKAIGAAQFLDSFGIKVDPKTLANSRAFEAQTKKLVLDFMNASGGARGFAKEETQMLMDAFPKIVDSPDARQQILDTLRRKSLREIQNYNNNVGRFKNAYPNAVIPFDPIETEEDQYQRWKQSRGGK